MALRRLGVASGTAAGLTIATTAFGLKTSVAHAANPNYDCEAGEVCLFENNDFNQGATNHVYQWEGNDDTYTNNNWYDSGDGLNDEASSVKNNGGGSFNVTLYQHSNQGGASSLFEPGQSDGYLTNNAIGDNRASSHRWTHV